MVHKNMMSHNLQLFWSCVPFILLEIIEDSKTFCLYGLYQSISTTLKTKIYFSIKLIIKVFMLENNNKPMTCKF